MFNCLVVQLRILVDVFTKVANIRLLLSEYLVRRLTIWEHLSRRAVPNVSGGHDREPQQTLR